MFGVTVLAVTKVIVAVCIGAFTSQKIPNANVTIRDFSFLIANVLLPCLTFYNTALSVSLEVLIRCSALILFAFTLIGLGLVCGSLASRVLFRVRGTGIPPELQHTVRYTMSYRNAEGQELGHHRRGRSRTNTDALLPVVCVVVSGELEATRVEAEELLPLLEPPTVEYEEHPFYYYGALVACSLQNSVTLPLSLLQALAASLAWIDLAAGTSYIFVYSIVVSAYFWTGGPLLVGRAMKESERRKTIREILETHRKLQYRYDVATQTEVRMAGSPNTRNPSRDIPHPISSPIREREHPNSTLPHPHTNDSLSEEDREDSTAHVKLMVHCETQTMPTLHSTGGQTGNAATEELLFLHPVPESCERFPYEWRERGYVRVVYARDFKDEETMANGDYSPFMSFLDGCKRTGMRLLQTLAFMSIVAGVLVGVIPQLRWLFFEGPLSMLTDSIALVAQGSIPSSLLLLGSNLASPPQTQSEDSVRLREAEQNTEFPLIDDDADDAFLDAYNAEHVQIEFDEHVSFTLSSLQQQYVDMLKVQHVEMQGREGVNGEDSTRRGVGGGSVVLKKRKKVPNDSSWDSIKRTFSLVGVRKSFVFGIVFIRLFLIPAVGFALVLLLRRMLPFLFAEGQHDVLLLVLLGEVAAPTAINSAILFNTRQYMAPAWSRMLFFQYILCTGSFLLWCSLSLWIVS